MERQFALLLELGYARKGPQIGDRLADGDPLERCLPGRFGHCSQFSERLQRRRQKLHPLADEVTGGQRFARRPQGRLNAAATAMAEHDDILHPQAWTANSSAADVP